MALFKKKLYSASIPLFHQAIKQNPNDFKAFYFLGSAQLLTKDKRNAIVSLTISCQKRPNAKLSAYVKRLRDSLTDEEQLWVDAQVQAFMTGKKADVADLANYPELGFRLESAMVFMNLADFIADAQSGAAFGNVAETYEPGYRFVGTVPTSFPSFNVEPVLKLASHFELGLPVGYTPIGTISETVQSVLYGNSSESFAINAFSIGLNARYLAGEGDLQAFLAGGPLVVPISMSVNCSNYNGGLGSGTGSFSDVAVGGQAQVGLDWHLGEHFLVTPSIGYQWVVANNFTGTLAGSGNTVKSRLEFNTNPVNGSQITLVPVGKGDPNGMRPLQVDLSGIIGGVYISALF